MIEDTFQLYFDQENKLEAEIYYDYGAMINFNVTSHGFSGSGPIYLNSNELDTTINSLSKIVETLSGEYTLLDAESNNYFIKFQFDNSALMVRGCLGDYSDHNLNFAFKADQTLIVSLIIVLKILYKGSIKQV